MGFTTSCSDDDNATALLQIDPSTDLVFEAVGGTRTIEVKTDQATWQVESNQTWCKVEKSDGTHFTVTAEENTASEPMPQAAVTVTAGTAQVVLKVDQKGAAIPPHPTDLVIQIDVTDITAHNAQLLLTPSNNNETYVAVCVLEDQINADGDENETMSTVINSFQPPVLTGVWSEALTPLMASTKYLILAFGIDEEKQTLQPNFSAMISLHQRPWTAILPSKASNINSSMQKKLSQKIHPIARNWQSVSVSLLSR